jgi:hypothetical protein
VRRHDEATEVVVARTLATPRTHRLRGRRARPLEAEPAPEELPLSRVTVVLADELGSKREGGPWLERIAGDAEVRDAFVDAALRVVNRALHAHRAATMDPYVHEVSSHGALGVRIGYGTGDELAEGRWSEAVELPQHQPRRRRVESLQPQERLAATLGGKQRVDACETLLLRARLDLDQARPREAALQLRVGLEALLAELPGRAGPDQEADLAALEGSRSAIADAANRALRDELRDEDASNVEQTLGVCERILRRRRILSD